MKQKQIIIYRFGRGDIEGNIINPQNLLENKITLAESFLLTALECYKKEKFENGHIVTDLIKVMLPGSEEAAKLEWEDGLIFNGNKYYGWFATTGGMKQEDSGKCETIFIKEDIKMFIDEFEDLISVGKFKEIEESKQEICINKDVLSRISLSTSSSYMAGEMPSIIVLPQPQYRIVKDYKTINKIEGDPVDYELVDCHFDKDVEMFDGGGIATPEVFTQIRRELKVDYPVEFAIIRGYGLGIKGMITKFDIIAYLDDVHKEDTEYCRKFNGEYQLLDKWEQWQTVTDKTILLNESMVKLAKYYDSEKAENMSTYKQNLSNVDEKYKNIINILYVTKINKRDSEVEEYRRLNYQLLTALALSKKDYLDLMREDGKALRKILKPFMKEADKDGKDQWVKNLDSIRLFFKNVINEETEREIEHVTSNVINKCEELLNISEDFIKLRFVRNNLAKLIEKKSRELACGKITAKAKYQYIAVCPISYMSFAMHRDQGAEGLNAGEFYSFDCNNNDIRTIARNPLCAYSEVHNVTFKRSPLLDKWLSHCRELIYFNQKSDILALMSSADTDGDGCLVVDNEIIKNAVVAPQDGKYFINKDDGKQGVMMEYNNTNRFLATYQASGNLIGSIALKAASINSNSQQTYNYYDTVSKSFILYSEIKIDDEDVRKSFIKTKLDSGEWLYTIQASEQHKEHIRQRFYDNEKDIYIVLYNAMISIDSPKTLYFPSKADMKIINDRYYKKAHFLQYKEKGEDVDQSDYQYTFGLLDNATGVVEKHLLDEIDKVKREYSNSRRPDIIQLKLINGEYNKEEYSSCFDDIVNLYNSYSMERGTTDKVCKRGLAELKSTRRVEEEDGSWNDDWMLVEYNTAIKKLKDEQYSAFKDIDAKYIVLADEIITKYDMATIANALGNLKNCTEDFIINLFYPVFGYLNDKLKSDRYVFIKAEDGDITYLHRKYRKVKVDPIDNSNIIKGLHLEQKHLLKVIKLKADIRVKVLYEGAIELIESELQSNGHILFDVSTSINKDGTNQVLLSIEDKVLLGVFPNWIQIGSESLLNCTSAKFEMLVDVAKNKKSLKLTMTEATV